MAVGVCWHTIVMNMNVASVLQDSASNSSLEFNFDSHIYEQNTLSGNYEGSFNVETP